LSMRHPPVYRDSLGLYPLDYWPVVVWVGEGGRGFLEPADLLGYWGRGALAI